MVRKKIEEPLLREEQHEQVLPTAVEAADSGGPDWLALAAQVNDKETTFPNNPPRALAPGLNLDYQMLDPPGAEPAPDGTWRRRR